MSERLKSPLFKVIKNLGRSVSVAVKSMLDRVASTIMLVFSFRDLTKLATLKSLGFPTRKEPERQWKNFS